MKRLFLEAIQEKRIVKITFNSKAKGIIIRKCIPFDFGPSRRSHDKSDKYHFYDLDSPDGNHNLSVAESQLMKIELTKDIFDPQEYITWEPNWFIKRDWGRYS